MIGIESHSSVVEFNKLGVDSIGENVQSNTAQKLNCNTRTVSKEKTKSPNEVIASKILLHAKLFLHT